jgi:hypothetical protein
MATMTLLCVFCGIALALLVFIGFVYNSFVNLRNNSDEAFSTMGAYLKRRYDLIPNLVDIVKRYAIHEQETLERVIGARNAPMGARNFEERSQGDNMLSGTLRSLFAVTESFVVGLTGGRGTLRGEPGDLLTKYAPGEYGIVEREIFETTFEVVRKTR